MLNTPEIPEKDLRKLKDAAIYLNTYFTEIGFENWCFMGIQKIASEKKSKSLSFCVKFRRIIEIIKS